ncbi:MAG: hypothetical protein ACRECF_08620 [Methyloceanibacter sp.]
MSDRRRRYKESEVIDVLIVQGIVIPCYRCGEPITSGKGAQREHLLELALGGKEETANCRYSHATCHAVVTDGARATSAGSSKHRIAKSRRMQKANSEHEAAMAAKAAGLPKPAKKRKSIVPGSKAGPLARKYNRTTKRFETERRT